jgi:DNA-binding LacI/PurR family transcriptional regulator
MITHTIYDVAEKAGVSISTVSRVLNNNPNVLDETRQKVMKVIAELQFKPNPIARGLVVKQTNLIEVFFSWAGYEFGFNSPWYSGILDGINQVVQENQYGILINTIAGVFDPQEVYRRVFHNAVDGVLMVSPYLEEKEVAQLMENRVPVVLIGYRTLNPHLDFVDSDNMQAAGLVVDHLVKLGHKKISIITGQQKVSRNASDRLSGFKLAMHRHGLIVPDDYVVEGDFLRESGETAMQRLLSLSNRPTAVFASNDLMALGALKALEKAKLKAGKDIALVGFDDIGESATHAVSLTTVKQDYHTISVEAARILLQKIQNPEHWRPKQILVPTQLVVRTSCGSKK